MSHKVAVILFPGSNCELEALRACERSHLSPKLIRWNDKEENLENYDAYILPGGFSYEDRGRSGIIASIDPIMGKIKNEAMKGKPVLGLCNGAQILVETRLVPAIQDYHIDMALTWNVRMKEKKILGVGYFNDWIYIKNDARPGRSVFNRFSQKTIMRVPVAHGEGRFTTRDPKLLNQLIKNDQTLFRYCDENGKIDPEFPINTNGSMYNLAGICNPEGNVLALMPHPERTIDGQPIFDSLAESLKSSKKLFSHKISSEKNLENSSTFKKPKPEKIQKLNKKPDITILIKLNITDNEERTLENTLHHIGYGDVQLQRQIFLGFYLKNKKNLSHIAEQLIKSGEILNLNKEVPTIFIGNQVYTFDKEKGLLKIANPLSESFNFFITEYENYMGKALKNNLAHHVKNNPIENVERGVFWMIKAKNPQQINQVIQTHIFHNPHSMKIQNVEW